MLSQGRGNMPDCLKGFVAMMPTYEQQRTQVEIHHRDEHDYSSSHIARRRGLRIGMRDGTTRRLLLEDDGEGEV